MFNQERLLALVEKKTDLKGDDASQAILEYRKFLMIAHEFPDKHVVPPEPVDEVWHTHILDTKNYVCDCMAYFGTYLHHEPGTGLNSQEDCDTTVECYRQLFGEPTPMWEAVLSPCKDSSRCTPRMVA